MKSNYVYGSLAPLVDLAAQDWSGGGLRLFGNDHPLEVEIGFGTGEYLAGLSAGRPGVNCVGFEECPTRIIKTLRKLHQGGKLNVRLLRIDALWGFRCVLAGASVERVHCLFPCPWPKKRHAKNRLFQPAFLKLVRSRLRAKGTLRIVTDHHPYAEWIVENLAGTGFTLERRMIGAVHGTKFETKWRDGGQALFDELVLTADQPYEFKEKETPVKIYFCKGFDPRRLVLEGITGRITISFPDRLVDDRRGAAMVHAIVSEDGRMQHVWIAVDPAAKGWRVAPAAGTVALPTEGVRLAVERVFEAVEKSVA